MSGDPDSPLHLPLHGAVLDGEAKLLRVARRPGRPRRAKLKPDFCERTYIEATNAARDKHIVRDPLVLALVGNAPAERVLREIVRSLARESASIAFESRRTTASGRDAEVLHARRIDGLVKIAGVLLGERRAGVEARISDERLKTIATLWVSMIREAAEALPADVIGPVIEKIERAMSKWLERQAEIP